MNARDKALAVLLLTRETREWLQENDPKAFEQSLAALREVLPDVDAKIVSIDDVRQETDNAIEQAERMLMDSRVAERAIANIANCIALERGVFSINKMFPAEPEEFTAEEAKAVMRILEFVGMHDLTRNELIAFTSFMAKIEGLTQS